MGTELALTTGEQDLLDLCCRNIEAAKNRIEHDFIWIGAALLTIQRGRLHRSTGLTFEAFCLDRWGFKRTNLYRYLEIARDFEAFTDPASGEIPDRLPETASQWAALGGIPPERKRQAWKAICSAALDGKITARLAQKVAKDYRPQRERRSVDLIIRQNPALQAALSAPEPPTMQDIGAIEPEILEYRPAISYRQPEPAWRIIEELRVYVPQGLKPPAMQDLVTMGLNELRRRYAPHLPEIPLTEDWTGARLTARNS